MKKTAIKIFIFVLATVLSLFLANDGGLVKIDHTAIISAIGIDYDEQSSLFEISAQVAVPKVSGTGVANTEAVLSAKGQTIGSAISNISTQSGWYPKLSFCNLVLIDDSVLEKVLPETVNYLLYSTKIYDSALIVSCAQSTRTVLESLTPMDAVSSFAIDNILTKNMGKASEVFHQRAKDIALSLTGKSKYALIPLIEMISGQAQGSDSDEGKNKSVKDVLYNATTTKALAYGKHAFDLDKDQTLVYNLLKKDVSEAYITVPTKDKFVLLKISDSKHKISIRPKNNLAKIDAQLTLTVYMTDMSDQVKIDQNALSKIVPNDVLSDAENYVYSVIESLIDLSLTNDCDIFGVRESLFKHYPDFYKKGVDISNARYSIKVKIKGADKK